MRIIRVINGKVLKQTRSSTAGCVVICWDPACCLLESLYLSTCLQKPLMHNIQPLTEAGYYGRRQDCLSLSHETGTKLNQVNLNQLYSSLDFQCRHSSHQCFQFPPRLYLYTFICFVYEKYGIRGLTWARLFLKAPSRPPSQLDFWARRDVYLCVNPV